MTAKNPTNRSATLLALGAGVGLVLAALGLLRTDPAGSLETAAIARVGEVPVYRQAYDRAVARLAAEQTAPLDESDRAHILGQLVDEELLVQRALELGLARSDRAVRNTLIQAMAQAIVADSDGMEPSADELASFYEQHRADFARPARLRLERLTLADPAQAEPARRALVDGVALAEVAIRWADPEAAELPSSAIPVTRLGDYLGADLAQAALELEPGEVSAVIETSTGAHLLRAREKIPATAPELDEIRPRVRAEYRRRASDAAMGDYLRRLRDQADLELAEDAPPLDPATAGRLLPEASR